MNSALLFAVERFDQPGSAWSEFWKAAPGLLWAILTGVLILFLRKQIKQLLSTASYRIGSGASLKAFSFEIGSVGIVSAIQGVKDEASVVGAYKDKNNRREKERDEYYQKCCEIMLVHTISKSREPEMIYDVFLYVIPKRGTTLTGVERIEYYFGRHWNHNVYPISDRARGFPIKTAAFGAFLCCAEVYFTDGRTPVMLHRYIDFEMGAHAPAASEE